LFETAITILSHPGSALPERDMSFWGSWLESKSSFSLRAGFRLPSIGWLVIMENPSVNGGESGVSERKIRIERNCLHVKLLGCLVILKKRIGVLRNLICPQIEHIRVGVLGWLGRDPRFFIRGQTRTT